MSYVTSAQYLSLTNLQDKKKKKKKNTYCTVYSLSPYSLCSWLCDGVGVYSSLEYLSSYVLVLILLFIAFDSFCFSLYLNECARFKGSLPTTLTNTQTKLNPDYKSLLSIKTCIHHKPVLHTFNT